MEILMFHPETHHATRQFSFCETPTGNQTLFRLGAFCEFCYFERCRNMCNEHILHGNLVPSITVTISDNELLPALETADMNVDDIADLCVCEN
ncbi:CLUMA_CG007599, isoform A [Clunio marinus]|uniref:CLUMA_CG007599, isoform A n=1 Tax=Clunio marinus TaxID=568069 RepID=A0A1J1I3A3_9DIPT|nr:CLUMA_CG007599, isoform A [Clunio marinus]